MIPDRDIDNFMARSERLPARIECSCGRRVAADDVALCVRCDKVLCDECGTETEMELSCCAGCMVSHVRAVVRECALIAARERGARDITDLWRKRYTSMRNLASVCMVVIAGMVIYEAVRAVTR